MIKIFDTFLYYDEIDILKIRLEYLNEFINKFIIVECDYDFNSNYKGFNFNIDNFKKYKNKIIYYKYFLNKKKINDWYIHDSSRDFLYQKTKLTVNRNDFVIHGDIDEIPNSKYLNFFIKNQIKSPLIFCFKQKGYFFKFNFLDLDQFWKKSKITQFKNIVSFSKLRKLKGKSYSNFRLDILFHPHKSVKIRLLKYGGWHFTWIRSSKDILKKICSVIEFKNKKKISIKFLEKLLKKNINVVNFMHGKKTFLVDKNFELEFPNKLKNILHKYNEFINK